MQSETGIGIDGEAGKYHVLKGSYYLSQLAGWGFYGLLNYLLYRPPRGLRPAVVAVVWAGTALICTHVVALYSSRRHWRTTPQVIVPFAVAALVISGVMNAARIGANVALFGDDVETTNLSVLLIHYFQGVLVASVWCATYISANEARRRRFAETEALRLALVAQIAQFQALRSQLNPHFLFNCLNSLRELIHEDKDRATQVIDLLADLLRYTLRAGRIDVVSLQEELEAVRDYLALEKIRFEQRLRIRFDVAPETLEAKIPPMLLQTLAENGIKHGIAKLPAGGDLVISASSHRTELKLEVTNSGVLSSLPEGSSTVGLENARERLRLMYGEKASLTLAGRNLEKVTATILLPFSPNGAKS